MIQTLTRAAVLGDVLAGARASDVLAGACTADAIAMEKRSTTAPDYRSVHGTGLPFACMTGVVTGVSALGTTARTAVQLDALPGSPPRGGPV